MEKEHPFKGNTFITAAWINHMSWWDGWEVLNGTAHMQYPCVWLANPTTSASRLMPQGPTLLNEEERLRASRFRNPAHGIRFQTAHTLLRLLLACATRVGADEIRLAKGHHNKPKLLNPPDNTMGFNLSYTENRVMVGLYDRFPIGIDIEWLQRPFDFETMLGACFSQSEIDFITADKAGMRQRFFALWTRKEAVLKLTGEGINDNLPAFEVLDGENIVEKEIIGGHRPDAIHLYSFPIGTDFMGCMASPAPLAALYAYLL